MQENMAVEGKVCGRKQNHVLRAANEKRQQKRVNLAGHAVCAKSLFVNISGMTKQHMMTQNTQSRKCITHILQLAARTSTNAVACTFPNTSLKVETIRFRSSGSSSGSGSSGRTDIREERTPPNTRPPSETVPPQRSAPPPPRRCPPRRRSVSRLLPCLWTRKETPEHRTPKPQPSASSG